jgi:ATP-binding cassette subfamily C protein LapB
MVVFMKELMDRLKTRPLLATEILIATFIANILALASSLYTIQVFNRYVGFGVGATLMTLIAGVVIAVALEFGFRMLRNRLAYTINDPINHKMYEDALKSMSTCESSKLDMMPVSLRQQVMNDVDAIKKAYSSSNVGTLLDLPFTLLFIIVVGFLSFTVVWVVVAGVLLLILVGLYNLYALKHVTPLVTGATVNKSAVANVVTGSPDMVRSFNASGFLGESWGGLVVKFQEFSRKMESHQHFIQTVTQSITALTSVFVIAVGAIEAVEGNILVGSLIGINLLAARALMPISKFNSIVSALIKAQQSKRRLAQLSSFPVELQQGTALQNFEGRVTFQDLSFAYPRAPSPLFESVELDIKPGTCVGVIGPNASGKSTFMRLLMSLVEPTRGSVLVDGVELRQVVKEWWRKQVCYLPQEPSFINGTIRENIMLPNPELDPSRLASIIDICDLRNYIDESPEGLDHVIKENGRDLSAGIKRRIALARSLVSNGKLIIFDEPTEALDPHGRQAVYRIINGFIEAKRTMIVCTYDRTILDIMPYILDLGHKPEPKLITRKAQDSAAPPAGDKPSQGQNQGAGDNG